MCSFGSDNAGKGRSLAYFLISTYFSDFEEIFPKKSIEFQQKIIKCDFRKWTLNHLNLRHFWNYLKSPQNNLKIEIKSQLRSVDFQGSPNAKIKIRVFVTVKNHM